MRSITCGVMVRAFDVLEGDICIDGVTGVDGLNVAEQQLSPLLEFFSSVFWGSRSLTNTT